MAFAANYDPNAGSPLAWLLTVAQARVDRVRSEQAASQRESRYGAANVDRLPTTSPIRSSCATSVSRSPTVWAR